MAVAICVLIASILVANSQDRKHSFADAKAAANKVVIHIGKQDGKSVRALGNKQFQSMYTDSDIQERLDAIKDKTATMPQVVAQAWGPTDNMKSVDTVYKYTGKTPYFLRISEAYSGSSWQLTDIAGSKTMPMLAK